MADRHRRLTGAGVSRAREPGYRRLLAGHSVNAMRNRTSLYGQIIMDTARELGLPEKADPATAALIEDMMRDGRSGLDGLTRAELAGEAASLLTHLEAPLVVEYAAALDMDCPSWAKERKETR